MSLHDHVWPAVLWNLQQLVGTAPLVSNPNGYPNQAIAIVAEGEQLTVPDWPAIWLINDNLDRTSNSGAQDLMATHYRVTARVLVPYAPDSANAEHLLMPLEEQISARFWANLKLNFWPGWASLGITSTVADCQVKTGDYGYLLVGETVYRTLDLQITIVEKERKAING